MLFPRTNKIQIAKFLGHLNGNNKKNHCILLGLERETQRDRENKLCIQYSEESCTNKRIYIGLV